MIQVPMPKWWQLSLVGTLIVSGAIAISGEYALAQPSISCIPLPGKPCKKPCTPLPGKPCNITPSGSGSSLPVNAPANPSAMPPDLLNELRQRYPQAIQQLQNEDPQAIQKLQQLDSTTLQNLQKLAPESTQQIQPFLPQLRQQPQQIYLPNIRQQLR